MGRVIVQLIPAIIGAAAVPICIILVLLLLRGQDVAVIFADIRLSGVMDGIDLAREVKMRWPHLVVVLTSGNAGEYPEKLPPGVVYMPKPWNPVSILAAVQHAISSAGGR